MGELGEKWNRGTHQELLARVELSAQLTAQLAVGQLKVLTQVSAISHEGQVTVIADVRQLVVLTLHVGHVHVVGRRRDILVPGRANKECLARFI